MKTHRFVTLAVSAIILAACGGADIGGDLAADAAASKGGTPEPTGPNPLPSTPPSPDMVIRESFGPGPDFVRPSGGKGTLKPAGAGVSIGSFWVEYPGSKNMSWIAPDSMWEFAGCSDDPYELASPIQPFNGCVVSSWADGVVRFPSALVPFRGLAGTYEISADVYPAVLSGAYVALGFTPSGATTTNLQTAGQLWMLVRQGAALDGFTAEYELHAGNGLGTVLASGTIALAGYNPISLRYDPATQTASATVGGTTIGPFSTPKLSPSYAAFEGQGVLDNFVVRSIP